MKVVCENTDEKQKSRNEEEIRPLRQTVSVGLSDILCHEDANQGDEQHRYVEGVPKVAHKGVGVVREELPFCRLD